MVFSTFSRGCKNVFAVVICDFEGTKTCKNLEKGWGGVHRLICNKLG